MTSVLNQSLPLLPMGEWVDLCSGRALYNGMASQLNILGNDQTPSALSLLCDVIAGMTPPREYRDKVLLASITEQLETPRIWASLILYLQAIPQNDQPVSGIQVDFSTPLSLATRAGFFRKVVAYVVNPDNQGWLTPAIDKATAAPGMRALSLAIRLGFEHRGLTFDAAMALAAFMLLPALDSGLEPDDLMPVSQALNVDIPRLDSWCHFGNPEYLFQQLGIGLLCLSNDSGNVLKWRPAQTWQALSQTAQFSAMFAPLLLRMGWYGGKVGEQASPRITQALAGRAIVDYFLGANEHFSEPLEQELRGNWVCKQSHGQLCALVRSLIVARHPGASSCTHDMLYYLLLREAMPELLVEGVPDHLQYGRSLQSVALIHGVALLEALAPGLAQKTAYDELIKLSAGFAQSSDVAVHALWAQTLTVPALRYALAHGAIEWTGADDIGQASAEQVRQALTYVTTELNAHAQELHDFLSLQAPDREELAQRMLTYAGVDRRLWDDHIDVYAWPILQEHGLTVSAFYTVDRLLALGRPQASVVELVMMGEVYVEGQPTVPDSYARDFALFRDLLVDAQTAILRRLLAEMQPESCAVLLQSTCEVSRVRFGTGELMQEGTQGLFIRCQSGDQRNHFHGHAQKERFFELIPASGVVREVDQQFDYSVETLSWTGTPSPLQIWRKKSARDKKLAKARVTPLLPMDSDAYLNGSASRSSSHLHTPRNGELVPAAELMYLADGPTQTALETFAQSAARHLLASFLELTSAGHLHQTSWEKIWADERYYADLAARLIIPFYGCIRDLEAGDHSTEAVAGCALDLAFALIPLGQFAGSTARIVLHAGELSVLSLTRLTGNAVVRLIGGLAQLSVATLMLDLGKGGLKLTRFAWAGLQDLPALEKVLTPQIIADTLFGLDHGAYRIADDLQQTWQPRLPTLDQTAVLDGQPGVVVRNIGTADEADFRLLDPRSDSVFGKQLTILARTEPVQVSVLSTADSIGPGHYPPLLPATLIEDAAYEVRVAQGSRVQTIEREQGVYDFLIDNQIYHLDANAPDTALRKLAIEKVSPRAALLEEAENLCRVRRDLLQVPCATGVKLSTPSPEPLGTGSTSPKQTGKYPSQAMDAREFSLARLALGADSTAPSLDVFVYEGKFCKWARPSEAVASTSVQASVVIPLSEAERAIFLLPDTPAYLPELDGVLAADAGLGLPENFTLEDARAIYEHAPVIQFGPIAAGIDDSRALRGIRHEVAGSDWIFVEPDTGIFYKAATPVEGELTVRFSRITDADEINEFIRLSEEYRLVRERPDVLIDRENIARLLFDLLDESERAAWHVSWARQIRTYDDYAQWCVRQNKPNELHRMAVKILAGEELQKKFVTLTKESIPDFKKIAERSVPEQQHIVEVLNQLLPVQGSSAKWEPLTLANVATRKITKNIMSQVKGANLAFAQLYTEDGRRIVYYSLSGGEKARDLKLQLDVAQSTERTIDGVIYRDARARMQMRDPDPTFTSLPVVRDADRITVREFGRDLDSERLIATVIKEDMVATRLSAVKVFTVLDTCRSCGGVVLPRLKLDFPGAQFTVTYLKNYGAS